jgi:diguanylate cyclase (GGDEF)-like protein
VRILVADDELGIRNAYKMCLEPQVSSGIDQLDALGDALFGDAPKASNSLEDLPIWSGVDYVDQGEAAVAAVKAAVEEGRPYGVLFLDMRMPPGMDGRETAKRVRAIDPEINIVIVTGYSDHSPIEVAQVAGPQDKLYYIAKPFETDEVRTLASALTAKWTLISDLRRTQAELADKIAALEAAHLEVAASEARSRHIALHDQLTRLPNRLSFQNFLGDALANKQENVAVLLLDLDRFKQVNDTLGHGAGDQLVCEMSDRLAHTMPEGSIFARLGGDEFGLVLRGEAALNAVTFAEALVGLAEMPFTILGNEVTVGLSAGVAIRGDSGINGSELLRRADLALYAAKLGGRSCARLFETSLDDSARKRSEIDARLRMALANNALSLVYQPIMDPSLGDPIGYEALVRWHDTELGVVPPALFIPIAEETGFIRQLGEWIIQNAIAECAKWPTGIVSINLSTRQFQSTSIVDMICREASKNNVPLDRIQVEITETALFDDSVLAAEILVQMRQRGIRVALDDFGTGYSSLVNLKDFEIDCIKIDRSFISTLGSDRQASAIVTAVTSLARSLGLKVVAEGVENELQVQSLRLVGCELMQGHFYSEPVTAAMLPMSDVQGKDVIVKAA